MALREKKGRWEYRFKVQGQSVSKLTAWAATEENRKRAEAEEKRHRDAILRGETELPRAAGRGFTEVSEEFMGSLEFSGIEASSVERIRVSMASLRVWFGELDLGKIDARQVEAYKIWRLRGDHDIQPVKPVTAKHDLAALQKFFNWAKRMKIVGENPVSEVKKPSDPDGETRMHILTEAEEMDYFDRAEKAGYRNLADISRLILEQGMRPEEALELEKGSIDLDRGTLKILRGKTKAARRTLKMTAVTREIIARRMWESASKRWLFPTPNAKRGDVPLRRIDGLFDKVCRRAAYAEMGDMPTLEFVMYDLRHTFATRKAERGMPLTTLAAILGHSSLRMVVKYVHPTQDHMDREMLRIEALEREERLRTKTDVRSAEGGPGPTGPEKGAHDERRINNLETSSAKEKKPN